MSRLSQLPIDRFLLAIITSAITATLLPVTGIGVDILEVVSSVAVGALFYLYGVRLSPAETIAGLKHWRLHLTILSFTFVVFPLIGLATATTFRGLLGPGLAAGVIYLTLVPGTVQTAVAFTAIAKGNVAGAVVSSSASNMLGVVATPMLAWLLLGGTGHIAFSSQTFIDIGLQLLLPFVLGQLTRRWTLGFVQAHPRLKLVDRGSVVLVVYAAFSAARREGIWTQTSWQALVGLVGVCLVILAIMLPLTWFIATRSGFNRADAITIQFCGTKKSLASGLPMAAVLFAGQPLGLLVLPLVLFHQAQLMACSTLAARYAKSAPPEPTPTEG